MPVVLSDAIDGAAALALVDVADRAEVRSALAVALKIGPRDRERFELLFEAWWGATPPEERDPRRGPERTSPGMASLGGP
ncbi:MAG TPA: hypothetical protein VFB61_09430, partial [Gemmatimonadales bacterium]|nr:hypothetical protein [Gemmatimonadales bacterium]